MGSCCKEKTVGRERTEIVAGGVHPRFVETVMCRSKATAKCCRGELLELNYAGKLLCRNWTSRLVSSSADATEVKEKECVASLDPLRLSLVGICKRTLTSKSAALLLLAESQFENAKWLVGPKTGALK